MNRAEGEPVGAAPVFSLEHAFESLPPLGSAEFLEYIRTAPSEELPAQVLVRAYRQLPPGSSAARSTLERLVRRRGERWDYLECLTAAAQAKVRKQPHQQAEDYEDLFQDALTRILSILHTERGAYAEKEWVAFCWRQVSEAWRERYGRRGERLDRPRAIPPAGDGHDIFDGIAEPPPWHGTIGGGDDSWLESLLEDVIASLQDGFVRDVARSLWLGPTRPKTSGKSKNGAPPPLTEQFPEKSRDQINRAVREAKVQLAAAIVATDLERVPERFHPILRSMIRSS